MTIDYSDAYLYWDQTETATTIAIPQQDGTTASPNNVTVQRMTPTKADPEFSMVRLEIETRFYRVPAVLLTIDAGITTLPLYIGSRITIGSNVWQVTALREITIGASLSHYIATTIKE